MPPGAATAKQPAATTTPLVQVQPTAHPRRPPAHRSVSLLHHSPRVKPARSNHRSDSSSDSLLHERRDEQPTTKRESPSSLQPGQQSSGESSNADKWFDKSNNEIGAASASFADNDPPFFMRNSSSSETPPDTRFQLNQMLALNGSANSLPLRTGLLHLGTDASSTDDFRSVIDDLTIENKKLKRRLKKFEKLHDAHLKDEKLFEVRIHGLPPEKKRELEEMLRKFTANLGTNGFPLNGYEGLVPFLNTHKTSSSQASLQNTDSAYASISASGQASAAHSAAQDANTSKKAQAAASRHQNIHSYLHQIPEGLVPQQNPANMSDRARKRLVVRRLEQIFSGKGAVGGHHHPLQQQELSRIAAHADQVANEAQGEKSKAEGGRVASFMLHEMHDPAHSANDGDNTTPEEEAGTGTGDKSRQNALPSQASIAEQRPTRPLDLDPHRAQVPADNIEYIRHLGFSPPDPGTRAEEGHGWIYLNLLINMAQLHTINVTAEFVRKSVSEYSSNFELSPDGRKIRWKGGRKTTRGNSSSGGESHISRVDVDTPESQSPRKRLKTLHGRQISGAGRVAENKMVYTPLFFHKDSEDGDDSSSDEEDNLSSPFPAPVAGDSSGMTSSGVRTVSTKKQKKREDGPIIFYNNARFCTDLSGERRPLGNMDAPPYVAVSAVPLGGSRGAESGMPSERRSPFSSLSNLYEPMQLSDNPIPEHLELSFPARSPPKSREKSELEPITMEATGIGGVRPADNFTIAVESRHALHKPDASEPDALTSTKHVPKQLAQILPRKRPAPTHDREIVSVRKRDLPPSHLPGPVSFMPFGEDYMSDEESDEEDAMSESPESPGAMPPSTAPQPVELPYVSSDEEDEEEDDDEEAESEGSLDLLASARKVDPEAIRAREREYDANMAERLAEEIPAGSSAATAGGGSGFASPGSGVTGAEYRQALKEARSKGAALSKAMTADSMVVEGPVAFDVEEDGSRDEDDDEEMSDIGS